MSLVRYEPWNWMNQFTKELDRAFRTQADQYGDVATSDWTPAVDIKEGDKAFTIIADIPGVDPNDIEVHMENGILSVKGHRETTREEEKEGYKRVERSSGTFYRRFSMPETANADKIEAKSKNGVLEITIPKLEQVQSRKISVKQH